MSYVTDGSLKAFARYRDMLRAKGAKPVNETELPNGDPTSLNHLLWMCEHCLKNISDRGGMSTDKYSRWMGYVQGVMIMRKLTTVEEERNTTRPWLRNDAPQT